MTTRSSYGPTSMFFSPASSRQRTRNEGNKASNALALFTNAPPLLLLCLALLAGACKEQKVASKAALPAGTLPKASASPVASADPCLLDTAKLAEVRAKVPTLRAGMSRAQVNAVLGLNVECFGASGQGSEQMYGVGYRISPTTVLALTWERADGGYVLASAAVREGQ
jgi:hypothetical protein